MLGTDKYEDGEKAWNKRRPNEHTWDNWKTVHWEAYAENQQRDTIWGEKGILFGGSSVEEGKKGKCISGRQRPKPNHTIK